MKSKSCFLEVVSDFKCDWMFIYVKLQYLNKNEILKSRANVLYPTKKMD